MTYHEIVTLLKLYRKNELLWNHKHSLYSNKQKRLEALEAIRVRIDEKSIDEVRRRLKVIRDTYNIEKNRINGSKKSGVATYHTKLPWYKTADEFLSRCEPRKSPNTTDNKPICNLKLEPEVILELESTNYQPSYETSSPAESMADPGDSLEQYQEYYKKQFETTGASIVASEGPEPAIPSTKIQTVAPQFRPKLNNLDYMQSSAVQPNIDEFQYFGLHLVAQLRELPKLRALILQEKLQRIVSQERIEYESSLLAGTNDLQNIAPETEPVSSVRNEPTTSAISE